MESPGLGGARKGKGTGGGWFGERRGRDYAAKVAEHEILIWSDYI